MRKISPWLLMIVFVLVAVDQLTKLIVRTLLEPGESIRIVSFLRMDHIQNRGMAFGMMQDHGGLIVFIGATVLMILTVAIIASREDGRVFWPLALLVSGSAGNLIDRFTRGSVTDFIHVPHWPSFNFADIYIVVGVLLLVRVLILTPHRDGPGSTKL